MIKQTVFAVSKTQAHFVTTGVLLEIIDNQIIMVSTDMYRLAMRKELLKDRIDKNIKVLIPGSSLLEIGKLLSENGFRKVKIITSDRQVLFIIDNTKIMIRLISGDYIKYDVAFPKEYSTCVKLKANDFLDTLEITNIFNQSGNSLVRLNIRDQILIVSTETELGNMQKDIIVETEGRNIEIGFNARYLIEMLRVINDEEIELYLSSSILPMVIKTVGNSDYSYLVFPVRLNEKNNDLES
jgi:DNA polymerase-3 subunit beta